MRTVTDYTFGVIPMFLLMGRLRLALRHEPRAVGRCAFPDRRRWKMSLRWRPTHR
jgi:hypothetical protein